jgi:hypothetical protein
MTAIFETREEWLQAATSELRAVIDVYDADGALLGTL